MKLAYTKELDTPCMVELKLSDLQYLHAILGEAYEHANNSEDLLYAKVYRSDIHSLMIGCQDAIKSLRLSMKHQGEIE